MAELILFLISTMGLTYIIVDSVIAEKPVEWLKERLPNKLLWFNPKEALDCHQCTGFWAGLFCAAVLSIPWAGVILNFNSFAAIIVSLFMICVIALKWFLCGCAGSIASLWIAHYLTYLETRSIIDIGDLPEDEH